MVNVKMKEIYKKTSLFSFVGGIGMMIFSIFHYFYIYEGFRINGDVLFESSLLAFVFIGAGFYFRGAYAKLAEVDFEGNEITFDIENMQELNIQRVPSLLPKVYSVDADGNPLLKIEPSKEHMSRWLMFFKVFECGFLFPVHYDISTIDGERFATIKIRDNVKKFVLSLRKPDGTLMGYYIQKLSKSAFKNRGILYHADGTVWRELEAKSLAGDIDVKDEEGLMTASYRFGIFPYAMRPAFQSTAYHKHVRFGTHVSSEEKLAYMMIFFYWLRE